MSPTPEERPEQVNESEALGAQIASKRQQIASLKAQIRELERRRRELKRRPVVEIPVPPPLLLPVDTSAAEVHPAQATGVRLALAGVAFLLAGLGQYALRTPLHLGSWLLNGWIPYAIAVVLFLIAFRQIPLAHFSRGKENSSSTDIFHATPSFWILLGLSLVALTGSLFFFKTPDQMANGWRLQFLSVLLFIAAFIRFDQRVRIHVGSFMQFRTLLVRWLPILGVLVLAAAVRFWHLDQIPFGTWYDEAFQGNLASRILQEPTFRPVFYEEDALPSHLAYLFALSFRLFGTSTAALRYVTAAFGVLTVLLAYLLFRRWLNEGMALAAAFLFAVMRYDITFSRIAMHGVTTPAFELAALYLLDRALERRRLADFAWLGLVMGLGLGFYTPYRLFVVIILGFLALIAVTKLWYQRVSKKNSSVSPIWNWPLRTPRWEFQFAVRLVIVVVGMLIAISPLVQFAINKPEIFMARLNNLSIFRTRDEPDVVKAIWNNTTKHLLMYNVQGDRNGRHNLPGQPTLDPIMGVLFILGLGYALWRWRDPPNLLMLLIFFLMNLAGILSVDFEAPQSLRAIGVMPALVYFSVLPIALTVGEVRQLWIRQDERLGQFAEGPAYASGTRWTARSIPMFLGILSVFAVIAYLNINMYFNKQQPSPDVWAEHSAAETLVAHEMKRLSGTYDFLLSALYDNHPTVRFLAGDVKNDQRWTVNDRLPLTRSNLDRGIVLLFDRTMLSAYGDARRFYPNAKFIEHHPPGGDDTILYEAIVEPKDLKAISGVAASYTEGNGGEGKQVSEEILPQLAVDWSTTQPLPKPFSAEIKGILFVSDYGPYSFRVQGTTGSALWIDEFPVEEAPLTLARGAHTLRLQVPGSKSRVELLWQPPNAPQMEPVPASNLFHAPVTNHGLLGAYYTSPDWSGEPAFTQIDPELAFYFHITPLPRPYSVEWTGKLYAPTTGEYQFALDSVDDSQFRLDGSIVVDNPNGQTKVDGKVNLTQGWHAIDVHFGDRTGGTRIYLYWIPPGTTEEELVPSNYLLPPMGQYPAAPDMPS